jgi:hypothetical protein
MDARWGSGTDAGPERQAWLKRLPVDGKLRSSGNGRCQERIGRGGRTRARSDMERWASEEEEEEEEL